MRQALFLLFFCCCMMPVFAKHITGGEFIYDYLGPGGTANSKSYNVTLRLFRDALNCTNANNCAELPSSLVIGIYNNDNSALFGGFITVDQSGFTSQLPVINKPACLVNEPLLVYEAGYYSFVISLPDNAKGYTVSYQTCCRVNGIENGGSNQGATYTTVIPGTNVLKNGMIDNSPRFQTGLSIICYNKRFSLDFSATDPDPADSLVYYFCDAYDAPGAMGADYKTPAGPPYNSIFYNFGYSSTSPLGALASINPATGIISGIAPGEGKYVVSVCVESYRNKQYIGVHRKDFIVNVATCDYAGADLQPDYVTCDGFTVTFSNLNNSPTNISFYWEFGDGGTSTEINPTHTYADTGVYHMKLVVNQGTECADSAFSPVKVYPGYFPKFSQNSPTCRNVPVKFTDLTTATYGSANEWHWDFGVANSLADTSRLANPTFAYANAGVYTVKLVVASNKGCRDTIFNDKVTIVEKPPFNLTNDTLICSKDNLQLTASSPVSGSVTWSPNYNISDIHSFTPVASPKVNTTYKIVFTDVTGCSATDSVKVRVVDFVTLNTMADTTICRTDAVTLNIRSDALMFNWTPPATLNNPKAQNPVAVPVNAVTTYHVIGNIGSCTKEADIVVRTIPYPNANAGKDTSICFGADASLHASGGSIYNWSPSFYLNTTTIANPISQRPAASQVYVVTVRDILGCPKPVKDSVRVNVIRIKANAGPRDTAVVLGQPLQLFATGSDFYQWTPATWLTRPDIANPVSLPLDSIQYIVRVSNAQGCFGVDTIDVAVFKTQPDIFVPSAFSPNGDNNNDVFRPVPVGIRSLQNFSVYNRWGQLLFSTSEIGAGWNGKFVGKPQDPGTYVWRGEATDYTGKKVKKKGTVVLLK